MIRSTTRHRRLVTLLAALAAAALVVTLAPSGARADDEHRSVRAKIVQMLHNMTLQEKVGQLFITYAYGETADTTNPADVAANQKAWGVDNAAELIDKYHLGGIIYYSWSNNTNNPKQIAGLSNGIQRAAASQRMQIPALIATDQEGGIVARVGPPATQFPGNMALGAGRSTDDAYDAAHITGEELKAIGINQDYAPVSDVNVNPRNPVIGVRSFGSDPQLVSRLAAAQVDGYQDAGIAATAKHFPGHGDTDVDSHIQLPTIDHTLKEWRQIDKPPFQADINHGIDVIMTAHITVPALDPTPGLPATLSKPIMTGILRHKMHFKGVIVTDALGMGGVSGHFGDANVPVMALKAGVDMLLKSPDGKLDLQYNAVIDAVKSGELSMRRINQSVARILRLKFKLGLFDDPYVDVSAVDDVVGTPEHYAKAHAITDRTTTLVKNDDDLLPLSPEKSRDVLVTGWGSSTTRTLSDDIRGYGQNVDRYYTGSPTDSEIATAVDKAKTHDLTVVTTSRAWDDSQQAKLVKKLVATGKPVVAVAVRDPYDIAYYDSAPTYLATYSYGGIALRSLTRVMFGEVNPQGKLPVMIPKAGTQDEMLYPYGYGLTYGS
ncbi:MAG: glycoside hydrolase family 3 protein [Streptosporangiales bacterium]